jgi:hypothetical protein
MADRSLIARLTDIIEAIGRIRTVMTNVTLDGFESRIVIHPSRAAMLFYHLICPHQECLRDG